jgi:arsenite-transporting ATPase
VTSFSFIGGKGGVGKTTCAAVAALQSAAHAATLLVTTDPASSLGDALGAPVGERPRPVPGVRRLHAANVDASRAFARWLAPRAPLVAEIALRGTYLDEEDVARLLKLSLPGIDEVIGLIEISRLSQGFDAVIVDTAPTGHTLRLLAAPVLIDRLASLLDGLQGHHRAVVSALRGAYRADAADALIGRLRAESTALASLVRDPATRIAWVTLPEPMALEETSDALASLAAADIHVTELIVNRATPPPPQPCAFCDSRRRFEARALLPIRARFCGLAVSVYPELAREPIGVRTLTALGRSRAPWSPPPPARLPAVAQRVRAGSRREGRGPLFFVSPATPPDGAVRGFGARWLVFGGKGGVGKSTCAAAAALELAETSRVLLLSTDPAHSLSDVFGQRFDNVPRPVRGRPTLQVREIDAAAEMDRLRRAYVDAVDEAFARIARSGGDRNAFRDAIDLAPPGVDEVIAIAEVAEALHDGHAGYDIVVTDTAPTGHALRLLQTPQVLREWTQALMAILLKYREVVGAGSLAALLVQLSKRLRGLQDTLRDRDRARFVVVTRPAALPVAESRDLMAALDSLGIAVGAVIVNAVGRGTCTRCASIERTQAIEVRRLAAARGSYAIIEAAAEVPPPHGSRALQAWAKRWRQVR